MRKLRKAELKLIKSFPEGVNIGKHYFPGIMYGHEWPKGTNVLTLLNLLKLGLIEHAHIAIRCCPFKLTDKGKEILNNHD